MEKTKKPRWYHIASAFALVQITFQLVVVPLLSKEIDLSHYYVLLNILVGIVGGILYGLSMDAFYKLRSKKKL